MLNALRFTRRKAAESSDNLLDSSSSIAEDVAPTGRSNAQGSFSFESQYPWENRGRLASSPVEVSEDDMRNLLTDLQAEHVAQASSDLTTVVTKDSNEDEKTVPTAAGMNPNVATVHDWVPGQTDQGRLNKRPKLGQGDRELATFNSYVLPQSFVVLKTTAKTGATVATTLWRDVVRGRRRKKIEPEQLPGKIEALRQELEKEGVVVNIDQVKFVVEITEEECVDIIHKGSCRKTYKRCDRRSNCFVFYKEATEENILDDCRGRQSHNIATDTTPAFRGSVGPVFFDRMEHEVNQWAGNHEARKVASDSFRKQLRKQRDDYALMENSGDWENLEKFKKDCKVTLRNEWRVMKVRVQETCKPQRFQKRGDRDEGGSSAGGGHQAGSNFYWDSPPSSATKKHASQDSPNQSKHPSSRNEKKKALFKSNEKAKETTPGRMASYDSLYSSGADDDYDTDYDNNSDDDGYSSRDNTGGASIISSLSSSTVEVVGQTATALRWLSMCDQTRRTRSYTDGHSVQDSKNLDSSNHYSRHQRLPDDKPGFRWPMPDALRSVTLDHCLGMSMQERDVTNRSASF